MSMKHFRALPALLVLTGCMTAPTDLLQRPGAVAFDCPQTPEQVQALVLASWAQHSSKGSSSPLPGGGVLLFVTNPDAGTDLAARVVPTASGSRVTYNIRMARWITPKWMEQPLLDLQAK